MELTENLYHRINELETENTGLRAENKRLAAERDQLAADYERASRRCNRMACSADIEDVQWSPATAGEGKDQA